MQQSFGLRLYSLELICFQIQSYRRRQTNRSQLLGQKGAVLVLGQLSLETFTGHFIHMERPQEAAEQMIVSLNTVRFHVKSIYGKLGVDNRTAALEKARSLDLL